jgi:hypothetical protein
MDIRIGFTGTREGMTRKQRDDFITTMMEKYDFDNHIEFHHGDCIGADEDAHKIMKTFVSDHIFREITIEKHPCNIEAQRAFTEGGKIYEPKPPLERNHSIVDSTDILIACPKSIKEELRSGTWATIRYARKKGKKILMIYP